MHALSGIRSAAIKPYLQNMGLSGLQFSLDAKQERQKVVSEVRRSTKEEAPLVKVVG